MKSRTFLIIGVVLWVMSIVMSIVLSFIPIAGIVCPPEAVSCPTFNTLLNFFSVFDPVAMFSLAISAFLASKEKKNRLFLIIALILAGVALYEFTLIIMFWNFSF